MRGTRREKGRHSQRSMKSYTRNTRKKQLQRLGNDNGKHCKRDEASTRYGTRTEKQITNRSVSIILVIRCWWNCIQLYKVQSLQLLAFADCRTIGSTATKKIEGECSRPKQTKMVQLTMRCVRHAYAMPRTYIQSNCTTDL